MSFIDDLKGTIITLWKEGGKYRLEAVPPFPESEIIDIQDQQAQGDAIEQAWILFDHIDTKENNGTPT